MPISNEQILSEVGLSLKQTAAEIAAGVTPTNYAYMPGDVRRYGVKGDGSTDDTTALQNCYNANPGLDVYHAPGLTILVSAGITLKSGTRYRGQAIIKQKAGTNLNAPLLLGTSVSNVLIEGLEIDGNAANNATGLTYGIQFITGTNNQVRRCNIHDTTQAGIYLASETDSKILGCHVINAGRNIGTDNHGIMMISNIATPLANIVVQGNTVIGAYRKGITTYSLSPGSVSNISIVGNVVTGAGLGGIYTGNGSAGTTRQTGIVIADNTVSGCYSNIEADYINGGSITGNVCSSSNGFDGITCDTADNLEISGNQVNNSTVHGIELTNTNGGNNTGISIVGNTVSNSNTSNAGFAAGILLHNTIQSQVSDNTVTDANAKMVYGIFEDGTSNNNMIVDNNVVTAVTAKYSTSGAATFLRTTASTFTGFGVVTPTKELDIAGGIRRRSQQLTLSAGANNNVSLPSKTGTLYTTGLGGVFNISGFVAGNDGDEFTLINYNSFTMTINNNSGSSSAGNKILIGGGADITVSSQGSVDFIYLGGSINAWFVRALKA
jgi:hypothetical protein